MRVKFSTWPCAIEMFAFLNVLRFFYGDNTSNVLLSTALVLLFLNTINGVECSSLAS